MTLYVILAGQSFSVTIIQTVWTGVMRICAVCAQISWHCILYWQDGAVLRRKPGLCGREWWENVRSVLWSLDTVSYIDRTELFCDDNPDCVDGSDENLCGPRNDPNRAQACDNQICKVTFYFIFLSVKCSSPCFSWVFFLRGTGTGNACYALPFLKTFCIRYKKAELGPWQLLTFFQGQLR